MGITLPDWHFPEPKQKVARWLHRPLLVSLINPLWLVGYALSCVIVVNYWIKLRKASWRPHMPPDIPLRRAAPAPARNNSFMTDGCAA